MSQPPTPPHEFGHKRKPTFAVIFRTHFWDDFTTRQLERVRARTGSGQLFVLVDDTRGSIAGITNKDVFRLTDGEVLSAGYPEAGEGSVQWYSGDVPLYLFARAYPDFDYYVQLEYDVNLGVSLEELVDRVGAEAVDMVALSTRGGSTWHWLSTMTDEYEAASVRNQLICFSVFSRQAIHKLEKARLAQADRFRSGAIQNWPYCEGYIATEAVRQNLRVRELSAYGDVSHYEWWPPFHENELPKLERLAFVHPVLDQSRFEASMLKYDVKLGVLAMPWSWLHQKLRRLGAASYLRALGSLRFRQGFKRSFRQRFGLLQASEGGFNEVSYPHR